MCSIVECKCKKCMANKIVFREIINGLEGTVEQLHFEEQSIRIHKKIYLTVHEELGIGTVKLTEIQQSIYTLINNDWIYPEPNKWGKQGWTNINLRKIDALLLKEIIILSFENCGGVV